MAHYIVSVCSKKIFFMDLKKLHFLICTSIGKEYEMEEAEEIAWRVIEHVNGKQRNKLKLEINSYELNASYTSIIDKLNQGIPLQYVLGYEWWGGMQLKVDRHVLIPRPETEELTRKLILDVKKSNTQKVNILDIGTGSGCISLLLKKELPTTNITGCDLSEDALRVAKENSEKMKLDIRWVCKDITHSDDIFSEIKFDYIISNPPYITLEEKNKMHKRVYLHEPSLALFVNENDPLFFYKNIIEFAKQNLKPSGTVYLEINNQYDSITKYCFDINGYETSLENDMYGNTRFLIAKKP